MLAAFFHFVKMFDNIIAFFGSKVIQVPHIDDEGLMPFGVVHAFEAPPHLEGSLALVYMDHLSICEIALNLHVSERIVGAPVVPALGVNTEVQVLDGACDVVKHATGFECHSYFGLPDNPVGFVKVPSESYH